MSLPELLDLLRAGVRVVDLGRPLFVGMPQSPNHAQYRMALTRRHGDMVRADGGSAAADMLVTGAHVGTHIDALCHVSHDGLLHGGVDATKAQVGGGFSVHGAETIEPMVRRGVLLDVPAALGLATCQGGYEITPDDLDAAVGRQGVFVGEGDVVLIRSGWGRHWGDAVAYVGKDTGVPGVGEAGARWLAERRVHAVGADTIAFERLTPGAGHALLPAHRVLLVEHGIYIIETLVLDELAERGIGEFLFVLAPLKLVGATGSPVRPLAVVSGG
ncbi:cyclase family protein [Micromonospora carbonacea]|uniref:Kynurenine formamidase n=1 Tax=Micromonospora carbonacea TaxID=47853 RepID=A0A1C4V8H8_9ACTN|nr:cyclase family protein [Micromonospora carbonacea]SCE80340.1 Kynurenine formamidase [Micromonospora carbonacea]